MAQTNGGAVWTEDKSVAQPAKLLRVVAVDADRYTIAPAGAPAASLVQNDGRYALTPGDTSGTGRLILVGARVVVG